MATSSDPIDGARSEGWAAPEPPRERPSQESPTRFLRADK